MKKYLIVLFPILMFSCATYDVIQYRDVEIQEKTITTQPGSMKLLGQLKKFLVKDGWDILVLSGPEKLEKLSDSESLIYTDFKSAFTLLVWYDTIDIYLDGDFKYKFELSLIDNREGREAFTMSGIGKGAVIVDKFSQLLENRYIEE